MLPWDIKTETPKDTLIDKATGRRTWHNPDLTDDQIIAYTTSVTAAHYVRDKASKLSDNFGLLLGESRPELISLYLVSIETDLDILKFWLDAIRTGEKEEKP